MIIGPLFQIVDMALGLYVWLIIASAILSWLIAFNVVNVRNQAIYSIGRGLHSLTEPALRPIRRFLPNFGGIDISPVILILLIYFARMVLANFYFAYLRGL